MNRYVYPVVIFLVLVVLLYVGLQHDNQNFTSAFINKQAPKFSAPNLFGKLERHPVVSQKLFKGKVIILNFWASWCSACYTEHSVLMKLSKDKRVTMVGVAYKDKQSSALAFLKKLGNPFKYIAHDESGDVGIEYGVSKVPETFVIDKNGIVRYKHLGPISYDFLSKKLLPLIGKLYNSHNTVRQE